MKEKKYTLRECKYSDIDFIVELKKLGLKWYIEKIYGWGDEVQREKTIKELEENINNMKIIVIDGIDVGLTTFIRDEIVYCIGLTLIHPKYQNKKIATTILSSYIQMAKQDRKRIIIKTYKENPAKRLYERLGFKIYKTDDTHVHLEMDFSK